MRVTIFAIALAGIILVIISKLSWSHDAHHPENNKWLAGLASGNGPCCDGSEAVRVDDPDWEFAPEGVMPNGVRCVFNGVVGGMPPPVERGNTPSIAQGAHYCVRLRVHPRDENDQETKWYLVPRQAEVTTDVGAQNGRAINKDGVVRVWPITTSQGGDREITMGVRCFLAGAGG